LDEFSPAMRIPPFLPLLLLPATGLAQSSTWDGGGINDNWSTRTNWVSNIAPTPGTNTAIRFDGSTRLTPVQNIAGAFQLNSLVFLPSAGAFTLGGSGGLDFRAGSGGSLPTISQGSPASQTIAFKPIILSNNLEVGASGTGSLIITGPLTGPGAMTLIGGTVAGVTQRVILGGQNANEFSGGLVLGTDPQAGPVELSLATDNALGSGVLSMVGGNTLRNPTATARTIKNDFTMVISNSGGRHGFTGSNPLIFTGGINVLSATKTLQVDVPELRWEGSLSGTAALIKNGPGQLTINAVENSSYRGQIILNAGSLRAGTATSLATAIVTLNIADGLIFFGSNLSLGGLDGTANLTGPTGTLTLGRNGGGGTYTGALTTGGALVKTGSNPQIFSGGTSSARTLTVNNGSFLLSGANLKLTGNFDNGLSVGNASGTALLQVDNTSTLDTRSTATLLVVGNTTNGPLMVSHDSRVESASAVLAAGVGESGGARFDSGAAWTLSGDLGLGGRSATQNGGAGMLEVDTVASVSVGNSLDLWTSASILKVSGGTVIAGQIRTPTGAEPLLALTNPNGGFALTVGSNNVSTTLNARLSGTGTLRKQGLGTLTLTSENSTGGRVRVESGAIALGAPLALQNTVVELYRDDGITLFGNTSPIFGGLAGPAHFGLTNVTLTLGGTGTDESYSGTLSGNGSVKKVGPGTLVLSGMNTFTGGLTISDGRVELGRFDSLPNAAPITLTGPGTLTTQSSLLTLSRLSSAQNADGTGWLPGGTIAPAVTRTAPTTVLLNVPAATTQIYGGVFADAPTSRVSLTKTGTGTLRLGSDRHTFTGLTTIQQGVLELDSALAAPADSTLPGSVNVHPGTTLRLVSGPGLPARYVSNLLPALSTYATLPALDAYFTSTSPALFANSSANAANAFDFGSNTPGPHRFPAPFNTTQITNLQVRWSGKFRAATAGTYTFATTSDDGSVLYMDGTLVVNNNFSQGATTRSGSITLETGLHDIVIGYFQGGGSSAFAATYVPPGGQNQPLNNALLSYVSSATVGGLTGSGLVDLQGGRLTIAEDGYGVFNGSITDSSTGGSGELVKSAQGTLVLRGTNSADAGFTLLSGTLGVDAPDAIGSGRIRVSGSGQLFADSVDVALPNAVDIDPAANLIIVDDPSGPRKLSLTGPLSGTGAFYMAGTSDCVLGTATDFVGTLEVDSGRLTLTKPMGALSVNVVDGTLALRDGALTAPDGTVTILGGTLTGGGTVAGTLTNYGIIDAQSETLTFTGGVINYGVLRAFSGGVVDASACTQLVNYGTIDLISGSALLPANFTNLGLVLDSSLVRVKSSTRVGTTVSITIDGYTGHTYRLQRSLSLAGSTFITIGSPQVGRTGNTLTFIDPNASGASGFYRVSVD